MTMASINDAAFGFSENMKALQGNIFFRGYFKKKEKERLKTAAENAAIVDSAAIELSDAELEEIDAAAEKAHQAILDRKKNTKGGQ
jgi:phospholipid/cholesterol/gamma-HCH transport system substrate-binding protein